MVYRCHVKKSLNGTDNFPVPPSHSLSQCTHARTHAHIKDLPKILPFYEQLSIIPPSQSNVSTSLTKLKQSLYRSGEALWAKRGWDTLPIHSAYDGGKVVSSKHRSPLPPADIPGTHFYQKLSRPQGHSAAGSIKSKKNPNDTSRNRNRDLTACNMVPLRNLSHRQLRKNMKQKKKYYRVKQKWSSLNLH